MREGVESWDRGVLGKGLGKRKTWRVCVCIKNLKTENLLRKEMLYIRKSLVIDEEGKMAV